MQPYEIRQSRDGSIDYNNYYARPVSLTTPAMRRLLGRSVSIDSVLVVVLALAALAIAASASADRGARPQSASPAALLEKCPAVRPGIGR